MNKIKDEMGIKCVGVQIISFDNYRLHTISVYAHFYLSTKVNHIYIYIS